MADCGARRIRNITGRCKNLTSLKDSDITNFTREQIRGFSDADIQKLKQTFPNHARFLDSNRNLNPGPTVLPTRTPFSFPNGHLFYGKSLQRGESVDVTKEISNSMRTHVFGPLKEKKPYNISINNGLDTVLFRWGSDNVGCITNLETTPRHSIIQARAPIYSSNGMVLYTKNMGDVHRVYMNNTDLNQENEIPLCHSLSTRYEKNWGCFNHVSDSSLNIHKNKTFDILYSLFPLRIFNVKIRNESGAICTENRRTKNSKFMDIIQDLWVNESDSRGTSIFRGGSRGIPFGEGEEFLFVGHVTLSNQTCFPHMFSGTRENAEASRYPRMYFTFFYTIRIDSGVYSISRFSSCFQPPSDVSRKILFPVGIANNGESVHVSYGATDQKCFITQYSKNDVDMILRPIDTWTKNNYVFHPNYAASIFESTNELQALASTSREETPSFFSHWRRLGMLRPNNSPMGLAGLSVISPDPYENDNGLQIARFNPAVTRVNENTYVTAWRIFKGNVRSWSGENAITIEAGTFSMNNSKLIYAPTTSVIEFQVGTTSFSGEDPRLITENNCPVLMINDKDENGFRRMYVHNLATDETSMTVQKFCHNMSDEFEKNWGPFYVDEELHFVYSVDPLVVGKVTGGSTCPGTGNSTPIICKKLPQSPTPTNLKHIFDLNNIYMRGGTPGIKYGDNEYLIVGHGVQAKRRGSHCHVDTIVQRDISNRGPEDRWHAEYPKLYTIFFYTIAFENGKWVMKKLSCCSHLPGKREHFSKIVFPCGIATAKLDWREEDSYIVSFGEKDIYGGYCAITKDFLDYILRPVEYWTKENYVVDINYFENIASLSPKYTN